MRTGAPKRFLLSKIRAEEQTLAGAALILLNKILSAPALWELYCLRLQIKLPEYEFGDVAYR